MSSDYSDLGPPALSQMERQMLLLQHKILAHLDKNEADYHEQMVEVLTEGFTMEYENLFTAYAELPKADCRLVFDILDMFHVLKASLGQLDQPERDALLADYKYVLTFRGFDGNDSREGKMRSYVTYLQKTHRWTDLVDDVKAADGGNSHSLMLGLYEAMLDVYRPIWAEKMKSFGRDLLSADELRRVGEARA